MKKYCVKCGRQFEATGREVICPSCREAAKLEAKRAAVERAKQASWRGESVPVRISGRASTLIRRYGAENGMPFATALDALLKASDYFKGMNMSWEEVEPYKSRRLKKNTDGEQDAPQDVKQAAQEVKPQEVKTAKKTASKSSSRASTAKK